jgi:hypothetical protein
MRRTVLHILVLILSLIYSDIVSTQTAEGGGVYIRNNGKLINSIVTENYAVNGFGVAGAAGEVVNCKVTNNYYLKSSVVYPGDMFFDDGVVFTPTYDANGNLIFPENYDASNVIGICFWSNTHNDYINGRSWILALDEVSLIWCPRGLNADGTGGWNPPDIPDLYNYQTAEAALMDYDGKGNTALIVNHPGFVEEPTKSYALTVDNCAAKYCYEYRRAAGEDAKWFLPSIGQLRRLEIELDLINELLGLLNKPLIQGRYWSSNERTRTAAWNYNFPLTAGQPAQANKISGVYKVRPVAMIISQR